MGEREDVWASGQAYEPYVGRWSRLVASEFVSWLGVPRGCRWLDVGCGTGALSRAILDLADPDEVTAVDPSPQFVEFAGRLLADDRAQLLVGDARALQFPDGAFDAAVAGLVLNFLDDPAVGAREMARVTRPGGVVATYVWDYAREMQLIRRFWDVAVALDAEAAALDEARRFALCAPAPLESLLRGAGLEAVESRAIDARCRFRDFDDYWSPFLGGQGPAPGYVSSLPEDRRRRLRDALADALPVEPDGSIVLVCRAWAARGALPG